MESEVNKTIQKPYQEYTKNVRQYYDDRTNSNANNNVWIMHEALSTHEATHEALT